MYKALKISENFNLIEQLIPVETNNIIQKEIATNHIIVIDCSGSMSYDLQKIRLQLKNKLPSLVIFYS